MLLDVTVGEEVVRNEHTVFVPWKSCNLPKAEVQCRVVEEEDGRLAVEVSTTRPSFISLEARGLRGEFEQRLYAVAR